MSGERPSEYEELMSLERKLLKLFAGYLLIVGGGLSGLGVIVQWNRIDPMFTITNHMLDSIKDFVTSGR